MKKITMAALSGAAVACLLVGVSPASAQMSPTCAWMCTPGMKDANQQAADLATATTQLEARGGYFKAPQYNTYYNGPVSTTYDEVYQGPVEQSSTTNAMQYQTSSAQVNQAGSNGSGSTINFSTGATSSNASQTATSLIATNGAGGTQPIGH